MRVKSNIIGIGSLWWGLSAIILISGSFVLGFSGRFHFIPTIELRWHTEGVHPRYIPSYGTIPDKELVMVFIGSSTCGYSNDRSLPGLIEEAKLKLQRKADDQGWAFSVIGVSVDWITADGITHLNKFGYFDEVMTGRKWHGTGASIYSMNIQGVNATPQILVLARNSKQSSEVGNKSAKREIPIYQVAGLKQIHDWLNRGLPLPQDIWSSIINTNS